MWVWAFVVVVTRNARGNKAKSVRDGLGGKVAGVLATRIRKNQTPEQHENNSKSNQEHPKTPRHKHPMTSFCWGQQGRELITELQRSNWLPPYNVSACSKVLAFVSHFLTLPQNSNTTTLPLFFFFFPHYLALSFLFSRNDFVKSWKKPKHVTMKSLNHWVQTWTCKTKDKRQL
jgi:hypothetical protein